MNLTKLPAEILAIIFSKIDWKSLNNVRLTSRKFHSIVENNIRIMKKRMVYSFRVRDSKNIGNGGKIQISYCFIKRKSGCLIEIGRLKNFYLDYSELNKFEYFLQRIDFSELNDLQIKLYDHIEYIKLFNQYYITGDIYESVYLEVEDFQKSIDNVLCLLKKITSTHMLDLHLSFPFKNVSRNLIIPIANNLQTLKIKEDDETTFLNTEMIEHFIENNPGLWYLQFSSKRPYIYKEIIKTIVKIQISRRKRECNHTFFKIYLDFFTSNNTCLKTLSNTLQNLPYTSLQSFDHSSRQNDIVYYKGVLLCNHCNEDDSIQVNEYRSY